MERHFVVVQSKEDFDRERTYFARLMLKFIGYIIFGWFLIYIFYKTIPINILLTIFFAYLILVGIAEFTTNRILKSYIKAILAIPYLILGILGLIGIFFSFKDTYLFVSFIIFSGVFFFLGYRQINKYTNLFKFHKKHNNHNYKNNWYNNIIFFKIFNFFDWGIYHSIIGFGILTLLPILATNNFVLDSLIAGIIITIFSSIKLSYFEKKNFFQAKSIAWIIIHSISFYIAYKIAAYVPQNQLFIKIIILGFCIQIINYFANLFIFKLRHKFNG